MARGLILPLILSIFFIAGTASAAFIDDSCKATLYPAFCVQSLSVHASKIQENPYQLAQTALSESLARAQSAQAFLSSLNGDGAVKDCLGQIDDGLELLTKSAKEMELISNANADNFILHKSNIETWVSAALTNEDTCVEGISSGGFDEKTKTSVKTQFVNVKQSVSIALALFKQYTDKHQ